MVAPREDTMAADGQRRHEIGVRVLIRSSPCARNSAETPVPGPVPPSLRGSNTKGIPDLFPNSFRGFNPCLALRVTHVREVRSFDHSRTIRFEYAPVVDKRYLAKPIVLLHISPSQSSCAFTKQSYGVRTILPTYGQRAIR